MSAASLSARRAWIEMLDISSVRMYHTVALRKESVDRNELFGWRCFRLRRVALRKESVDRNKISPLCETVPRVALRKESVDRNIPSIGTFRNTHKSLSARRAWIEISNHQTVDVSVAVALRKESVDRNIILLKVFSICSRRSPQGERG